MNISISGLPISLKPVSIDEINGWHPVFPNGTNKIFPLPSEPELFERINGRFPNWVLDVLKKNGDAIPVLFSKDPKSQIDPTNLDHFGIGTIRKGYVSLPEDEFDKLQKGWKEILS